MTCEALLLDGKIEVDHHINIPGQYEMKCDKILGEKFLAKINKRYAKDTISMLEGLVEKLDTKHIVGDYGETPSDIGEMVTILLERAKKHPNAKWVIVGFTQ